MEQDKGADLLTMSRNQLLVLDRMSEDLGYPFRDIASDCGIPESLTRRIIHGFHELGLTGYGPLYSEDGPGICGSGYWLNRTGAKLQEQFRRAMSWRDLWVMRDAAQAIEARGAKTAGLGPKDESAVHAPEHPQETRR